MDDSSLVPRPSSSDRSPNDFQTSVVCLLLSVFCLLTGCRHFDGSEDFYEVQIAPEKLRRIETLDLQHAEDEQSIRVDVNEQASAELELTLEQCRALTLENNLDLKVQLINPAIAAERVSQQEAQFEAAFSANVSYARTDTPVASTLDISGSNDIVPNVVGGLNGHSSSHSLRHLRFFINYFFFSQLTKLRFKHP